MNRALLIGLVAVVIAALIGGFMVVGGPGYARLEKQDAQRANDLQQLYGFLQCRASDNVLPANIEDTGYCGTYLGSVSTADPVTAEPYDYRRVSDTSFVICATFVTEVHKGNNRYPYKALKFEGQVGCRHGETIAPK